MFNLRGKVALVTGAATGIGQGISLALARQGAKVILSDKPDVSLEESEERIEALKKQDAACFAIDVRDLDQVREVSAEILRMFGRVDILVNNAGINRPAEGLCVD